MSNNRKMNNDCGLFDSPYCSSKAYARSLGRVLFESMQIAFIAVSTVLLYQAMESALETRLSVAIRCIPHITGIVLSTCNLFFLYTGQLRINGRASGLVSFVVYELLDTPIPVGICGKLSEMAATHAVGEISTIAIKNPTFMYKWSPTLAAAAVITVTGVALSIAAVKIFKYIQSKILQLNDYE